MTDSVYYVLIYSVFATFLCATFCTMVVTFHPVIRDTWISMRDAWDEARRDHDLRTSRRS